MSDQKNKAALNAKEKDIDIAEGELDSGVAHSEEISPDDLPNVKAMREAAREHGDAFIVKSDLEDLDQRDAAPGTREQK